MYPTVKANAQTRNTHVSTVRHRFTVALLLIALAVIAWTVIPVIPSSVWIALVFVGGIVAVLHNTRGGTR